MNSLARDLQLTLRTLFKRPGVTLVAAFCLATGIGAATVVFSLVDAVLLSPLAYPEPDQLHFLWSRFEQRDVERSPLLPRELIELQRSPANGEIFSGIAGAVGWFYNWTGEDLPERLVAQRVSPHYFELLGITPKTGRGFHPDDVDRKVVLLSHGLWRTSLGADPGVIGSTLSLDEEPHEVVGVLPADFDPLFTAETQIWVPLDPERDLPQAQRRVRTVVRLASGVSAVQAAAAVDAVATSLAREDPETYPSDSGWGLYTVSLHEDLVGDVRPLLWILGAAVALVLLIACANVANLLLAQATTRRKEIALRAALGARAGRIVRQLLTESVVLALLGGAGGLLFAFWGVRGLRALDLGEIPRLGELAVDARVLAFTLLISVVTGLLFGLAPALQAARTDLRSTLSEGGKTSASGGNPLPRNLLVVSQVALAVAMLSATGLMLRTVERLQAVDPGFRTDRVATLQLFLSLARYPQPEDRIDYYQRLMAEVDSVPGVLKASVISDLPLSGSDFRRDITIENFDPPAGAANPEVGWRFISPGYFDVLGIELLDGRDFDSRDTFDSPGVVIIDEAMAERYWPGQNPLGRRLKMNTPRPPFNQWRRIVGIARHVRHQSLTEDADEQMYIPYPQFPYPLVSLALETRTDDPLQALHEVREAARRVDAAQPLASPDSLEALTRGSLSRSRFNRLLFGFFGAVTLVLVAVGIYSVMAHSAAQRGRELGLRLALGSRRSGVLALVLRRGMALAVVGSVLGLGLAFVLGALYREALAGMVYGLSIFDPATILTVLALVLLLALAANALPALRAIRVDPVVVLREE